MEQDEYVIFAELEPDCFEEIVVALAEHFKRVQYGRQGDDWIWVHHGQRHMEIDTFYSMLLELKGCRRDYGLAREILACMQPPWIRQILQPPRVDLTR